MRKEKITIVLLYLVLLVFSFFRPTNTPARRQSGISRVTRNISLQTHDRKTGKRYLISQASFVKEIPWSGEIKQTLKKE